MGATHIIVALPCDNLGVGYNGHFVQRMFEYRVSSHRIHRMMDDSNHWVETVAEGPHLKIEGKRRIICGILFIFNIETQVEDLMKDHLARVAQYSIPRQRTGSGGMKVGQFIRWSSKRASALVWLNIRLLKEQNIRYNPRHVS